MRKVLLCLLLAILLADPPSAFAQRKKQAATGEPRVSLTVPLGVQPGTTTRITVRGIKLDSAKVVRFANPQVSAKILSRGKAAVPDKKNNKVGDTQLVVEVTVPAGVTAATLPFSLVLSTGETKPHPLLVENQFPVIAENEPNNGFSQAQRIAIPQVVDGVIGQPRDVDVFYFEGRAGQQLIIEVLAARHGSALDSILTLHDANGEQIAYSDDIADSVDSRLEVTLPRDGRYFISLIDANDQGGQNHVYRLVARMKK